MKLKITPQQKTGLTVTSSLSAEEFLLEARKRFPHPSPFMEEFLGRFERLIDGEKNMTMRVNEVKEHAEETACPACGTMLLIEFDAEGLEVTG